jgi:exosortase/archaeosortase family protein
MLKSLQSFKGKIMAKMKIAIKKSVFIKLSPFVSFVVPILVLYSLHQNTFEPIWTGTWENRMGYIFFLWLLSLETIISWEELQAKEFKLKSFKTTFFIIALPLPTIYVIISNYFGLNTLISNLAMQYGIKASWAELMPLSTEYLVFAVLFTLIIFLELGRSGLENYLLSTCFLLIFGIIYTINNVYPFGKFVPFQILVYPTTMFAANILNLMGYHTTVSFIDNHPIYGSLTKLGLKESPVEFGIAWPCAGIESLLIYTATILLFLRKSGIPSLHKIIYFMVGAIITYFINILRIVTIFVIAINKGGWGIFHDYYGPLYSLMWIISYPLIIIGTHTLWLKVKGWKTSRETVLIA